MSGKVIHIAKHMAELKPEDFQKWFEKYHKNTDWKEHYKKIGGVIKPK